MNRRTKISILLLAAGLVYPGSWVFAWLTGDSITRAAIETTWLLRSDAVADRSDAIRDQLTQPNDGGPASQVLSTFIAWAVAHSARAEQVTAPLSMDEADSVAERLGWVAVDSAQDPELVRVFAASESRLFRQAVAYSQRLQASAPQ